MGVWFQLFLSRLIGVEGRRQAGAQRVEVSILKLLVPTVKELLIAAFAASESTTCAHGLRVLLCCSLLLCFASCIAAPVARTHTHTQKKKTIMARPSFVFRAYGFRREMVRLRGSGPNPITPNQKFGILT